jgi:hypothetical protein
VSDFPHLGHLILDYKNYLEDKLQERNKPNGSIRRHFGKQMTKETKLRIHKSRARTVLKFCNETCVLKERDEPKLIATSMKLLRHLLEITKFDRERNLSVRDKLGVQNTVR